MYPLNYDLNVLIICKVYVNQYDNFNVLCRYVKVYILHLFVVYYSHTSQGDMCL
jgi:hypothetical protein